MDKDTKRTKELARIHCLRRDLGLDDETYRDYLQRVAGVRSSSELDASGRRAVLAALAKEAPKRYPGRPHNADSSRAPGGLRKLEALLADQKLPWSYADGIAAQMYGRERVAWCTPEQLRGIITALVVRQRKLGTAGGAA